MFKGHCSIDWSKMDQLSRPFSLYSVQNIIINYYILINYFGARIDGKE